jgi:hypothetical protein
MGKWNDAKRNSARGVHHVVNHVERYWVGRAERLAVTSWPYRTVFQHAWVNWTPALPLRASEGGLATRGSRNKPGRSTSTLRIFVSILLMSSTGCSRDSQYATDSGKKIDLTLPEPQVRVQPAQKVADENEASKEKKSLQKKNERESASAQRAATQLTPRQPYAAPANGKQVKTQVNKTKGKPREPAASNSPRPAPVSQRRDADRDGADSKPQDSRTTESQPYQHSDNPLHPSYRKK